MNGLGRSESYYRNINQSTVIKRHDNIEENLQYWAVMVSMQQNVDGLIKNEYHDMEFS